MCMNVLPACMPVLCKHAWCPHRLEDGIRPPGTGVLGCYELLYGCWRLKLGLLQEPQVFSSTKLPLRSPFLMPFNEQRAQMLVVELERCISE